MAGSPRELCEVALDEIRHSAGDDVRGAMYYDGDDFGDVYFREDVDMAYTDEDKATAIQDFVLEALGDPARLEHIYQMGSLNATVRWFEDGFIVHVPLSDRSGFSISFDKTAATDVDRHLAVVETVKRTSEP